MGSDRSWSVLGVLLVAMLTIAPLASAATLQVTDTAGQALTGTEIVFEDEQTELRTVVKTDAEGRAEVPPGKYFVWAPGHSPKTVTVGTTPGTVALTPAPWMAQNPGRLGRFGVAAGYSGTWLENFEFDRDTATQTLRNADGNVTSSTTVSNNPADSTNLFDTSLERNGVFVDLPVGLPRWPIGKAASVFSAVGPIVGWYDWEFKTRNRNTDVTTTFDGDGVAFGGFGEMTLAWEDCPWFFGIDASHVTNLGDNAKRPGLAPTPGGTVRSSAEVSWEQTKVGGWGGYTFATGSPILPSVAPRVGVEWQRNRIDIDGQLDRTFANGTSGTLTFKSKLTSDGFRVRVGIDARLTNWLPLYVRLGASFDDQDFDILAKFSFLFDEPN